MCSSYSGQTAGFKPKSDVISFIFPSAVWRMDLRRVLVRVVAHTRVLTVSVLRRSQIPQVEGEMTRLTDGLHVEREEERGRGTLGALIVMFFNVYLFFERQRAGAGEGHRERETRNPKQAPGSELSPQSLMRGLNPHQESVFLLWSRKA